MIFGYWLMIQKMRERMSLREDRYKGDRNIRHYKSGLPLKK